MFPGLLAWCAAFVIQFVIKGFVDREKVARSDSFLVRNYLTFPPREVLTETGEKLYWAFYACVAVFIGSLLLTATLY